jgi:hypothetical protein
MEILFYLKNKKEVTENFETKWGPEFNRDFAVGDTITVKKPARFLVRSGMAYTGQAIKRQSCTLTLDRVRGIDFEWDDYEKAVKLERSKKELRENYFDPAGDQLANQLDLEGAEFASQNTPNVFGVLGTAPTTSTPFLDAERRLFELSAPDDKKRLIISGRDMASFLANQTVQFNPADEISKQYKKGTVGMAWGWTWGRSNNLLRHTAGTWAGTVSVNGAGQSGSSLNINCTSGDTFKKGDKFSILNVNFVNPNSRQLPAGAQVRHFTVTADLTASATTATIAIYPAIAGPGDPYQNVDALPANTAAMTLWPGTSSPNGKVGTCGIGIARQAFGMAFAKFANPTAVEAASGATDDETGAHVSFVQQFDINGRATKTRFDMCFGFGVLYADSNSAVLAGA